jgi:flagellar hook-associated protein 2
VLASNLGLDAGSAAAGTGNNYDFTISVNGTSSETISIVAGSYTNNELAAELQSRINADTGLQAVGAKVEVAYNTATAGFDIVSTSYGSKSSVSVVNVGAEAGDLGLAGGLTSTGKDTAGTVGGETGFGVGNVLLPKLDSAGYGLNFKIKEGAVASEVTFSRGFGREMSQLIDSFLGSSGLLNNREDGIDRRIEDLDNDQSQLDRRISAYQERLTYQYIAMERIVSSLQGSGSFLDGLLESLPFTSGNN